MPAILALAATCSVAWLGGTRGAVAHVCSSPVEIPVNRTATVTVGVPAEAQAVVGVDVRLPDGFRLARIAGAQFWTGERVGSLVRFQGGPLAPFACGYFSLSGTATEKGKLVFPITVRLEDGTSERYTRPLINDPKGAQLVFAGTEPAESDYLGGGEDEGDGSGLGVIGWVLLALGLAGIVSAVVVRRFVLSEPPSRSGRRPAPRGRGPRGSGSSRPRSRTPQRSRRR